MDCGVGVGETGVGLGVGSVGVDAVVAVGGTGVSVGGTGVAVGGMGVTVGGMGVAAGSVVTQPAVRVRTITMVAITAYVVHFIFSTPFWIPILLPGAWIGTLPLWVAQSPQYYSASMG